MDDGRESIAMVRATQGRTEKPEQVDPVAGLGFEDLLNFHMISEAENYDRLDVSPDDGVYGAGEPATITEPYSEDFTMLRTWVTPSKNLAWM